MAQGGEAAGNLAKSAGTVPGEQQAQREKTWAELTPDERMERMRRTIRLQDSLIQSQQEVLEHVMRRIDDFLTHEHGAHGKMMLPAQGGNRRLYAKERSARDPLA